MNLFRLVKRAERPGTRQSPAKERLVRLGRTSRLLRGDYGEKDDNYRRYQP